MLLLLELTLLLVTLHHLLLGCQALLMLLEWIRSNVLILRLCLCLCLCLLLKLRLRWSWMRLDGNRLVVTRVHLLMRLVLPLNRLERLALLLLLLLMLLMLLLLGCQLSRTLLIK